MRLQYFKILFYQLSFIFFAFTLGCQPKSSLESVKNSAIDTVQSVYEIDPRNFGDDKLTIADFAADIEYIPLSNKNRMGFIKALKITSRAIYLVSDASSGGEGNGHEELFRFDKDGKNSVQIGKIGNGPGEYLLCNNFTVDEQNERIYINGKLKTVLVFNTDGKYIRQFKFQNEDQRFCELGILESNKLFCAEKRLGANTHNLWTITDTLGNIIAKKNNTTHPFDTHIGPRGGIFRFKNTISYWVDYNDTIFQISPDLSWEPSYIITPGEHKVIYQNLPFSLDLPEKLLEFYSPHMFLETNKYLISRYNFEGKFTHVFIDKNSCKTYVSYFERNRDVKSGIPNNFDGGMDFNPETYFTDNGDEYLAGYIQPYELKMYVDSDDFKNSTPKYPEKKKALEQLANSLDENDNPVLMLVKLK